MHIAIYYISMLFKYNMTYIQLEAALQAIRNDPDADYQNEGNVEDKTEAIDRVVKYEASIYTISEMCEDKY